MHAQSSHFSLHLELGEGMWARKEEVKAGAATAWKQRSLRNQGSTGMSIVISSSLADPVNKKSESGMEILMKKGEKELSSFLISISAKSALILKMKEAIKCKQKKLSRWGWQAVKLIMIQIKQLLTHFSSNNLLIWVVLYLNSLLLCLLPIICFKVSTLRFLMIFRNLNLVQLL